MAELIDQLRAGTLRFPLLLAEEREPAGSLDVQSPFDGARLGAVATADAGHVDAALRVARSLHRDRDAWLPVHERLAVLDRLAALMAAQADDLALLAASEGGKPLNDSIVEVTRAIDGVRLCAEVLRGAPGDVIPIGTTPASAGRVAFTRKEPIGVVVAVSAFNHPLNLIVHQASGRPASRSSSTNRRQESGVSAAGLTITGQPAATAGPT